MVGGPASKTHAVEEMMKSLLKGIQAWRSRRRRRSLERWARERAEGKRRFIFRITLTYAVTVVGLTDVLNSLSYGGIEGRISSVELALFLICGTFIGSNAWSSREEKYQHALRQARLRALPNSKNVPARRA